MLYSFSVGVGQVRGSNHQGLFWPCYIVFITEGGQSRGQTIKASFGLTILQ